MSVYCRQSCCANFFPLNSGLFSHFYWWLYCSVLPWIYHTHIGRDTNICMHTEWEWKTVIWFWMHSSLFSALGAKDHFCMTQFRWVFNHHPLFIQSFSEHSLQKKERKKVLILLCIGLWKCSQYVYRIRIVHTVRLPPTHFVIHHEQLVAQR